MSQIRRRMAETMNYELWTMYHALRNTPEFTPDVSSLAFLSGATVQRNTIYEILRTNLSENYAKQTQFSGCPNERKLTNNNGL